MRRWFSSYENRLLFVLSLSFGFVFFDRNAMSFLAPFVAADLSLSNTQIGLLVSALSLTWALSGYLLGARSDRSGRRKPYLLVAVIVFSVCSFFSGLASTFFMLLAARLLMGVAEGPILPISQTLMAMNSTASRRGHNMGIMQNFGSNLLGSCIAPLLLVALASHYHWRLAFIVAGIPGLIAACMIWKYVREPREVVIAQPTTPSASQPVAAGSLLELLRYRNVWLSMLIACFYVAWMVLGWAFMPVYYMNERQFGSTEMGILMSVLGASATLCSFIVPALSDRLGRRLVVVVFSLIGALTPLAALYFQGPFWMLCAVLFITWSASGVAPIFMATIPSETVPVHRIAACVGLVMGMGEVVGGVLSPVLGGWLADIHGLGAPLLLQAGCAIVVGVLGLGLIETAPLRAVGRSNLTAVSE
ncbi:MFS transporter [Pseudomonas sp. GD03817]|uniref:Major facilitator transporter n=1 Tax=Pseudomonas putida TRO1 TaxID=1227924 RepID=A0AAD2WD68_PSEPU|nr:MULTISPECIES: MFS transporter [Pseudomonas]ELS0926428.1 MFS transporter [Pseudomonas putida]ENY78683.1 major facilitator transporter [Pseudomonas putida TRO1]MCE0987915.1 MFS transporter [Pseudomonas alloputida]MDD2036352.1 MFS transporter [Pseudomonas putida]MDD2041983.1 MFS transporter [Pseudomonas putida]